MFIRSNVLVPCIWGFKLVGHWALDLWTLSTHVFYWAHGLGPYKPCYPSKTQRPQWCHYDMNYKCDFLPVNSDPAGEYKFSGKMDSWVLGIALGSNAAREIPEVGSQFQFHSHHTPFLTKYPHRTEVGSQFQCHSHHTPFLTKHPHSNNNIGPPIPLTTRVIITPH